MKKFSDIEVSICISVHNTEMFLRRCLESVVNQTLLKKEIILVNNGSTDSSLTIMLEYQEKYPEIIKVYSQKDKGLAQGRQTGINYAQGEFITFLDADDYVKIDAYKKMHASALKYNVDIVECQTLRENTIIKSNYKGVHNTSQTLTDYFVNGRLPTMLWMRLFKRSLFTEPVLPNIYVNNEDIFAFPCLLYKAKNIFYLEEQLHYYSTDNEESVMCKIIKKSTIETKMIENRTKTLYVVEHILNYIGKSNIDKNYLKEFNAYTARTILIFCLNDFKTLGIKDKINIACKATAVHQNDLNKYYKNFTCSNRIIHYSIKLVGFKYTLIFHKYFKLFLSYVKN